MTRHRAQTGHTRPCRVIAALIVAADLVIMTGALLLWLGR